MEVFSGIGDELRVAWMIDSFQSDDDVHQLGIVVVNVFDQFGLCVGWSRYENPPGVRNCFSDCVKIVLILGGVPTPDGVRLVMDVTGRMIRVQNESFNVGRAEMEHASFMVIDPNDRMMVMDRHQI